MNLLDSVNYILNLLSGETAIDEVTGLERVISILDGSEQLVELPEAEGGSSLAAITYAGSTSNVLYASNGSIRSGDVYQFTTDGLVLSIDFSYVVKHAEYGLPEIRLDLRGGISDDRILIIPEVTVVSGTIRRFVWTIPAGTYNVPRISTFFYLPFLLQNHVVYGNPTNVTLTGTYTAVDTTGNFMGLTTNQPRRSVFTFPTKDSNHFPSVAGSYQLRSVRLTKGGYSPVVQSWMNTVAFGYAEDVTIDNPEPMVYWTP